MVFQFNVRLDDSDKESLEFLSKILKLETNKKLMRKLILMAKESLYTEGIPIQRYYDPTLQQVI